MISVKTTSYNENSRYWYLAMGATGCQRLESSGTSYDYFRLLFGPFLLDESAQEIPQVPIVSVNTGPPETFSYGYLGTVTVNGDNNVRHSQVTGDYFIKGEEADHLSASFSAIGTTVLGDTVYRSLSIYGYPASRYLSAVDYVGAGYTSVASLGYNYRYGKGILKNPEVVWPNYPSYNLGKWTYNVTSFDKFSTLSENDYLRSHGWIQRTTFSLVSLSGSDGLKNALYHTWVEFLDSDGNIAIAYDGGDITYPLISVTPNFSVSPLEVRNPEDYEAQIAARLHNIEAAAYDYCRNLSSYEACRSAVQSVSVLDMNNIENSTQVLDPKGLLPPLKDLLEIKKHPAKGFASLYLWLKYAVKTSISDLEEVIENYYRLTEVLKNGQPAYIVKYGTAFNNGKFLDMSVNTRINAKVAMSPQMRTEIEKSQHLFSSLGLDVSIASMWDLVPFSFVVDWFAGIGDFLESCDYALFTRSRYQIHSVTTSAKFTVAIPFHRIGIPSSDSETFQFSYYCRWAGNSLPLNEFTFGSGNPTRHIFDGAALVIANW